jgi:haloacetate dehalogenase
MRTLIPGFSARKVKLDGASIAYATAGSGPPLLLLHGHPQSHAMWHRVAPTLAKRFTVVAADLRGYGDSSKPKSDPRHEAYSKRAMAADMVALMSKLGHSRFLLVGHDRGGRVGLRLCLDHPKAVEKFVALDISPTLAVYEGTDRELATRYFHWFFLIQAEPFPEKLISSDVDFYMRWMLGQRWQAPVVHAPEAVAEYIRCARLPGALHAMCEDYRAANTIDLEHDRADLKARRKVRCPVHLVWGANAVMHKLFDPPADFRRYCALPVTGRTLPSGHYIAEEVPDLLVGELQQFFESSPRRAKGTRK